MFGFIRGTIDEIMDDSLIVDNNGVGWQIFVPASLLDGDVRRGDEIKLYTYMSVSENAIALYGFFSRDDLEVFRLLLNVSGIGPRGALAVLGTLGSDNLRFAVLADDANTIARAPGVGKKTAQKIVLELKDKFALDDAFEKKLEHVQQGSQVSSDAGSAADEAVQALTALGYSGTEAIQAVKKADVTPDMDAEAVLKAALRNLYQ